MTSHSLKQWVSQKKLKQREKSKEGKTKKLLYFLNFLRCDEILREFAKLIKQKLCGYFGEPKNQENANSMLSKLELWDICYLE